MNIKKNDKVVVISGKDKGKEGKVLRADPSAGKLVVEGVNVASKHQKPKKQGEQGEDDGHKADLPPQPAGPDRSQMTEGVLSLQTGDLLRGIPQGEHGGGALLQAQRVDLPGSLCLIRAEKEERRNQREKRRRAGDSPDQPAPVRLRDFESQRHERENKAPCGQRGKKGPQRRKAAEPSLIRAYRPGYGIRIGHRFPRSSVHRVSCAAFFTFYSISEKNEPDSPFAVTFL